jgi:hypothetical protein
LDGFAYSSFVNLVLIKIGYHDPFSGSPKGRIRQTDYEENGTPFG